MKKSLKMKLKGENKMVKKCLEHIESTETDFDYLDPEHKAYELNKRHDTKVQIVMNELCDLARLRKGEFLTNKKDILLDFGVKQDFPRWTIEFNIIYKENK